ncbi:carboxymuconolactone decarboxylase family protein [Pedobacter deserti]|uniref:carboxymuconolactone decarboxylase family protein n=1 Tax=Pedobacter deserti TaxID=2817382 RepID=UPI00210EC6EC|nr:carboxymuconolactone decarboxylase family protein [Pedobacter sp. SYSU D00382]
MERISFNTLPKGFYASLMQVQNYVDKCGLDFKMLELMRMRVSQLNGCAYCLDMHYKEAVHAGEDALRLISVSAWRETNYYSPEEQAVLEFAERLTLMPQGDHNDDIHDNLRKYFNQDEIANITLAVAQINTWNRIVKSFGPEPGKYQVPAREATA